MKRKIAGIILTIIIIGAAFYLYNIIASNIFKDSQPTPTTQAGTIKVGTDTEVKNAALPTSGTLILDSDNSRLTYSAERIVGLKHTGTVDISEGSITFTENSVVGEFTIDMTTITDSKDNQTFLTDIASDDFFRVETYPTSRFVLTSITEAPGGAYSITGNLTILDKTNTIEFPVTLNFDGVTAHVQGEISIDRTKWGITFDSSLFFKEIGDRAIRDLIPITLDLTFRTDE